MNKGKLPEACPRLLLIYGAGSGFGKSTLGGALAQRIAAQHRTVRFFKEENVVTHPAFQEYVRSVQSGRADDIETLTDACQRFVAELAIREPEVTILDSVLPCWDWLYSAHCADTDVAAFSQVMVDIVRPLGPVLVFVEGDLDAALSRAIEDRGQGWALDLAELRAGQRNVNALASYFRRLRAGAEKMLARWPHRVVRVDTMAHDLDTCIDAVIASLGSHFYPEK